MELGSGSVLGSLLAGGLPPSHLPLNAGPHRRVSTLNASLESTAKIAVTYGETLRPWSPKPFWHILFFITTTEPVSPSI